MPEWFEDWFNTDEYLNVYRHRNDIDAQKLVELIDSTLSLPGGASVLDMACGAGRHSILFAGKGYNVTAVDLSSNLLKVAGLAAEELNLEIDFIKSDLRDFTTGKEFDLVLNLFTSFGYFNSDKENFSILKKAYELTKKGGFFVIDYFNDYFLRNNLVPHSTDIYNGTTITQERKIEGERVEKKIVIKNDVGERAYKESVRIYPAEELAEQLKKIGFEIDRLFGDFSGNTFTLNSSPRVIIIARK